MFVMPGCTNLEQRYNICHSTYHQDPQPDDIACTFLEEKMEKYTQQSSRKETETHQRLADYCLFTPLPARRWSILYSVHVAYTGMRTVSHSQSGKYVGWLQKGEKAILNHLLKA